MLEDSKAFPHQMRFNTSANSLINYSKFNVFLQKAYKAKLKGIVSIQRLNNNITMENRFEFK